MLLRLLSRNGFHATGSSDLDLWPSYSKNNRDLLLNKGSHPTKFEGSASTGTDTICDRRIDGQGKDNLSLPLWEETQLNHATEKYTVHYVRPGFAPPLNKYGWSIYSR